MCERLLDTVRSEIQSFLRVHGISDVEEDLKQCGRSLKIVLKAKSKWSTIEEEIEKKLHIFLVEIKEKLSAMIQGIKVTLRGNPRVYKHTEHRECSWNIDFA